MTAGAGRGVVPAAEEPVGGEGGREVPRFEIPGWRERWGIVAGITGRGGGPAPGFDLGLWTEQPVGDVMSRWRLFRRSDPDLGATVLGHQVHGANVVWYDRVPGGWLQVEGVDGHATSAPGVRLCVTVADCIPVYLAAPGHGGIALLHAGWRGTAAGILERGVGLLTRHLRCEAWDVVMHLGVGICGRCYEVGAEVMTGCGVPPEGPGPYHLDLRERLAAQGGALGLGEISSSTWCSAHDRERFYSHRASQGADGRMVAYLGMT
jgi:YfiH family protein